MTASASLNLPRRTLELDRLANGESVDLVVVGGGIVGTGVALEAAGRGLSVALLERGDLASGTSAQSSKLVHGGLRYLSHLELGLAWECARERGILMSAVAPHLVRPLPFLVALNPALPRLQGVVTDAGIRLGDLLRSAAGTHRRTLPAPRRVSALEACRLVPALAERDLRGAVLYWDGGLEDDARLVTAVARTAAARGASILTYCEALELARGRVLARDRLGGERFTLNAGQVVNATGAWAPQLVGEVALAPSKGVHLLVPAAALGHPRAVLTVPAPGEYGRFVFAVPRPDGLVMIGVTDDPHDGPAVEELAVAPRERAGLLDAINHSLGTLLTDDDVVGEFAGLRPLLAHDPDGSRHHSRAHLTRDHAVLDDPGTGAVTVVGGKLSTYRLMAEQAVDHVVVRGSLVAAPSRSARLALVGAPASARPAPQDEALPVRLVRRYGSEAAVVAALGAQHPELLHPVLDEDGALGVELAFGARHEGAVTAEDLIDRRTRLGLVRATRADALDAARRILAEIQDPVSVS